MALPKWITPSGSLGTVPELEYYEFPLDAYDATGGNLTYSLVSGRLPLGLQIVSVGRIQGIPVSELAGDTNVEYRFTVRAKNIDKQVADRTFSITITNIAPPIITPRNIDLGTYFDGTLVDAQLEAIEFTPGADLTWTLVDGELPKGLTLSTTGKLKGYLQPITAAGPSGTPGWDATAWDLNLNALPLGWDFPLDLLSKYYKFTVQVDDSVNIDISTYELIVFPRQDLIVSNAFGADTSNANLTVDTTEIRSTYDFVTGEILTKELTVSETDKHQPIILTTQDDLVAVRQDSYFAFKFEALDLDEEVIKFLSPTSVDYALPGGEVVKVTNYTALGSSGTTFKVYDTTGLYAGLAVIMENGLGSGRTIVEVVDSTTLILSEAPDNTLTDTAEVLIAKVPKLSINENSGWLTGYLPNQTANKVDYNFEIVVYKRDDPSYKTRQQYTLSVYGSLSDTITWVTPTDLGSIENGSVSEFYVQAKSTIGRTLYYSLTPNSKQHFPQGLQINSNGLIYGRVTFEVFTLDGGYTTFDKENTTFDHTYEFTVTASDLSNSVSATQTFIIHVVTRNKVPYENLYLKALPTRQQRYQFLDIVNNRDIFNPELIYRNDDPYFGVAKDIKFLFLPGLTASTMAAYMEGVDTNHFEKRIVFGDIKTAVALDENFNIKYEVVYVEVIDTASNNTGGSAANIQELSALISNPYYDLSGNQYTTAYPNGFNNMIDAVTSTISYSNQGALPGWMTSNQIDTTGTNAFLPPLGLTHGVVLAYTVPNASNKIAYKLRLENINFNEIDFTVDRYQLDSVLSENFNSETGTYLRSAETTFDRYFGIDEMYTEKMVVDYALSIPFDLINQKSISEIQGIGGMDGILDFADGEYVVFAKQEFTPPVTITDPDSVYNYGWNDFIVVWDENSWAYNPNTTDSDTLDPSLDATPGEAWDATGYVPGYSEYNTVGSSYDLGAFGFPEDPVNGQLFTYNSVLYAYYPYTSKWMEANQRAGVWQIKITNNIVTLEFVVAMNFKDSVTVRNGYTYGGTTIYLDPTIPTGKTVPAYTTIPRTLTFNATIFDGNGTRFLDYRDMPVSPEEGDKYIKFPKLGVFT